MSTELKLDNVTVLFGGLKAVSDLSFSIRSGELLGLIGPNGAGKTTIFNLITGVYRPTHGNITFNNIDLLHHHPNQITRLGIARTFQNIRLFHSLSVFDNVRVSMAMHLQHGVIHAMMRGRAFHTEESAIEAEIIDLLEVFKLADRRHENAKHLNYGDQRRLEIVRALATKPKLLLLDEPAAGMNPAEKNKLIELIHFIRGKFGIAIMLVEHDMKVIMNICQHIIVVEYGIKIAEGCPSEVQADPKVIAAYLGTE